MKITYLGHATVLIEMDGLHILTDPILRNRIVHLGRRKGRIDPEILKDIDAVLISHAHWDHLDIPSLKMLDTETLIIVPTGIDRMLRKRGFDNLVTLYPGDENSLGEISVTATKAIHDGARFRFFGDQESLGYIIDGSQSMYFAGDTDIFNEMVEMEGQIDVALLPVWGWGPTLGSGHLDPKGAAKAAQIIQPKLAIPIHWGTFYPIGLHWLLPNLLNTPPLEFKKHVADLAPAVKVVILPPGESHLMQSE